MKWNNHDIRKRYNNQVKTSKIENFHPAKNGKNLPMVPPLDHFQGKNKIAHLLPERSAHQDDHFLQT